jgi:hypothetical protein
MDFAIVYLGRRCIYRFADFFHHWYMDGSRAIGRSFMTTMTAIDQSLAVAITLRHFFEPLYKDYSVIGRILGVVFRTFRVLIGGAFYIVIVLAFALVYLVWLGIPAVIIGLTIFYVAKTV